METEASGKDEEALKQDVALVDLIERLKKEGFVQLSVGSIGSMCVQIRRAPDGTLWYGDLNKGETFLAQSCEQLPEKGTFIFALDGKISYQDEEGELITHLVWI